MKGSVRHRAPAAMPKSGPASLCHSLRSAAARGKGLNHRGLSWEQPKPEMCHTELTRKHAKTETRQKESREKCIV